MKDLSSGDEEGNGDDGEVLEHIPSSRVVEYAPVDDYTIL